MCYLWPCNVRTWHIWLQLRTQWRVGMQGRDGLDYSSVIDYLQRVQRLKGKAFDEVFSSLQAMEWAALEAWGEMRERAK